MEPWNNNNNLHMCFTVFHTQPKFFVKNNLRQLGSFGPLNISKEYKEEAFIYAAAASFSYSKDL